MADKVTSFEVLSWEQMPNGKVAVVAQDSEDMKALVGKLVQLDKKKYTVTGIQFRQGAETGLLVR